MGRNSAQPPKFRLIFAVWNSRHSVNLKSAAQPRHFSNDVSTNAPKGRRDARRSSLSRHRHRSVSGRSRRVLDFLYSFRIPNRILHNRPSIHYGNRRGGTWWGNRPGDRDYPPPTNEISARIDYYLFLPLMREGLLRICWVTWGFRYRRIVTAEKEKDTHPIEKGQRNPPVRQKPSRGDVHASNNDQLVRYTDERFRRFADRFASSIGMLDILKKDRDM